MESLTGIVYVSKALKHFDEDALKTLIEKSASNNSKFGITGFLFYKKSHFLQYIEGKDKQVNALMKRIHSNADHQMRFASTQTQMSTKKFESWSMVLIKKRITMELVLLDYLIAVSGSSSELQDDQYANIWRMVDKITHMQLTYLANTENT